MLLAKLNVFYHNVKLFRLILFYSFKNSWLDKRGERTRDGWQCLAVLFLMVVLSIYSFSEYIRVFYELKNPWFDIISSGFLVFVSCFSFPGMLIDLGFIPSVFCSFLKWRNVNPLAFKESWFLLKKELIDVVPLSERINCESVSLLSRCVHQEKNRGHKTL